jgi:hypothetical protein
MLATNARSQQALRLALHFDLYGCDNLNTILCTLPQPYNKGGARAENYVLNIPFGRRGSAGQTDAGGRGPDGPRA